MERDIRDPEAIGKSLLHMAKVYRRTIDPNMKLSQVADYGAGTLQHHVGSVNGQQA
jgi:hypothetical protein